MSNNNEITNFELRLQSPEAHIRRIFSELSEYEDREILNIDLLIQGMAYMANHGQEATDPDGNTVVVTPMDCFVKDLIRMAVSAGSRGVSSPN